MTEIRYIDDAIASGWPFLNLEDISARPLQGHVAGVGDVRRSNPAHGVYPGRSVVVASPGKAPRFATVTAINRTDETVTFHVWAEDKQPKYESPSSMQHTHD